RWFEVTAYPSEEGLSVYFKDITERKQKEKQLEEIQLRFDYILKATKEAISDFDLVNNKAYWHGENFKKLFGYDLVNVEAPEGSWLHKVHPDDIVQVQEDFQKALENGSDTYTALYRFRKADDTYAIVKDRSSIIRDNEGKAIRVISAMEDITERRQWEQAVANNEKRYRSLFNNAPLPQWIYDAKTLQILDVNEATIWHYGYSRPELLKMTIVDLRPAVEKDKLLKAVQVLETGPEWGIWKHKKKDGTMITVEVKGTTVDYNGIVARLATINDITEKDAAQKALLKSEENYKRLFNSAPLPQYICQIGTLKIIQVNEAAINQYGYSREEFLRMAPYDLRPNEERTTIDALHQLLKENRETQKVVTTHIKKNGERIVAEINAASLEYEDCDCVLVTITDITNERELEDRIIELKVSAQKKITKAQIQAQEKEREEIGRELHDNINQQLTTIKLYMDLAKAREDLRLGLVEKSETVLNKTINEIRTLSKSLIPPVLKDVGLQQALEELIDSFRIAQRFAIELAYLKELDAIDEDLKVCFYRVVQEQLTNISKYANASMVWVDFERMDQTIYLSVRDDGQGFDTTKKRTGVGITNIKNRLELFNGSVALESTPGSGCSLHILVPYEHLDHCEAEKKWQVLVAENNTEDQRFLKEAFNKLSVGSTLLFKNNGIELLEHLQSLTEAQLPDLIVMDYNMPQLNGLDTLQALHLDKRFSRIPKIIYSTSTNKRKKEKSLAAFATAYIEKGATPDEIAENVQQMLSFAQFRS
ncbi:MAG: hypothetical protein JWP88_338, partial [Flaviaesturariibacter sp.]|nr:hypothetical protein [Flaviaesturariibacter sp.]